MIDKLNSITYSRVGKFIKEELNIEKIEDYLEYKDFIKNLEKYGLKVNKNICKNKVMTNLQIFISTNVWICDINCEYKNKNITITLISRIRTDYIDIEDLQINGIEKNDEYFDLKFDIEKIAKKSFRKFVFNKYRYIDLFLKSNKTISEKKLNYYLEY